MSRLDKYSRYIDKNGRLFVLLAAYGSPYKEGEAYGITPTTVDLLEVEKEALVPDLTVAQFEDLVNKNLLKQIPNEKLNKPFYQ